MRIAQVAPLVASVPPEKYGGTERVIAALTAELMALGHEVTLYASGDSATEARLVPLVERALWRAEGPFNADHLHFAELARVVRDASRYDVVHSHLDYLAFPFGRLSSAPFVHTMHGRLDLPELKPLLREFNDASLVSISNSQRRPVPDASWVATVYNGVALGHLPFGEGKGGYLAFLGRISPEKGVADAIDVARKVGIPLKIAARMPLANVDNPFVAEDWAYYREHVQPRLDSSLVEFVGEIGDHEKGAFLGNAMALLFPINWPEPFGLAMAEALACGTPVIARAVGSAPEVIDDDRTGFLCSTVEEMAARCEQVAAIDRAACRREAERRFSSRAMALRYLDTYAALVKTKEAPFRQSLPARLFGAPAETARVPA